MADAFHPAGAGGGIRLAFIDGLRGLAILMVFFYHAWREGHSPWPQWWNPLRYGFTGVNLFLVISGFCLYWPMVKHGGPAREPSLADFARRRARRILPPYYAAAIGFAIVWWFFPSMTGFGYRPTPSRLGTTLGWHLLMVHNLRAEHIFSIDGPLWSLPLEVDLYIAMPLLVLIARRWGMRIAVAVAACITFIWRVWVNRYVGGAEAFNAIGHEYGYATCFFFLGRWVEFALGMWAARLVADGVPQRIRFPFFPVGIAALLTAAHLVKKDHVFHPLTDPLFGFGYFCLLMGGSKTNGSVTARTLGAGLRFSPLVWIGTISYSFYLLHEPLLKIVTHLTATHLRNHKHYMIASALLFFPAIMLCAALFYLVFERPFLGSRRKVTPANAIEATQGEVAAAA